MIRTLVAVLATVALALAAAVGLSMEPSRAGAYDPPVPQEPSPLSAAIAYCIDAGREWDLAMVGSEFRFRCLPPELENVGTLPRVARRAR